MNQPNANDLDDNIVSADCNLSGEMYSNDCNDEVHIIDIKLQNQDIMDTNEVSKEDVVLFTINASNNGECFLASVRYRVRQFLYFFLRIMNESPKMVKFSSRAG